MRTATNDWLDTKTGKPKYGVDVLHNGVWKHLAENGKPCIYDTEAERDAKRAEYRKIHAATARAARRNGVRQ